MATNLPLTWLTRIPCRSDYLAAVSLFWQILGIAGLAAGLKNITHSLELLGGLNSFLESISLSLCVPLRRAAESPSLVPWPLLLSRLPTAQAFALQGHRVEWCQSCSGPLGCCGSVRLAGDCGWPAPPADGSAVSDKTGWDNKMLQKAFCTY